MKTCRTNGLARSLAPLFLLLLLPGPKHPGKTKEQAKHLPPEVVKAKSVYLDTMRLDVLDTAFLVKQHMQQWGRFQIEDRPEKADLILTFEGLGDTTAMLIVRDSSYHQIFWRTSADGGSIPWRCIRLVDLFRMRIEADEASQSQAAPPVQQPGFNPGE
jgi:hypothetical protein